MASVVSQEVTGRRPVTGALGKSLLDVITSGMYSDPRMAIREYIQNAVDSIDLASKRGFYANQQPCVQIALDGLARTITVEDNGVGIAGGDVDKRLGSLGCSLKAASGLRGFRGIGRLGGLAYCDLLRFETRQASSEPVHVVEWSGPALREQIAHSSGHEQLADAVRRIATVGVRRVDRGAEPDRFFRVQMINVHRFHSDLLMSVKGVKEYLAQTAPVGFSRDDFPYAKAIETHLSEVPGYRPYIVMLNGERVMRPYQVDVQARAGTMDTIKDVELVEFKDRDGQLLCRGWYAQTGFLSALPQHVTMRGVRIRQGNIAVGDEFYLKDYFSESRFATWHIGELHVSSLLKLNARRDGFEESSEYEDFLEQVSMLCRKLGGLCRVSSKDRSAQQTVARIQNDVEQRLTIPFFIDEEHARQHMEATEQQLAQLRRLLAGTSSDSPIESLEGRLAKLRKRPRYLHNVIDGRALRRKTNRQVLVELCARMRTIDAGHQGWRMLLEVVKPYLKTGR